MPHDLVGFHRHPLRHWPVVHGIGCTLLSKRGMGVAAESPDVVRCGADPEEKRKGLPDAEISTARSGAV